MLKEKAGERSTSLPEFIVAVADTTEERPIHHESTQHKGLPEVVKQPQKRMFLWFVPSEEELRESHNRVVCPLQGMEFIRLPHLASLWGAKITLYDKKQHLSVTQKSILQITASCVKWDLVLFLLSLLPLCLWRKQKLLEEEADKTERTRQKDRSCDVHYHHKLRSMGQSSQRAECEGLTEMWDKSLI